MSTQTTDEPQQPDTRPGSYYVSCRDAGKHWLMSGPYIDNHAGALAAVERVRAIAVAANEWAWFYSWGTCRIENETRPGNLQKAGYSLDLEKI